MTINISVWEGNKTNPILAQTGAEKAFSILEELSRYKSLIFRNIERVSPDEEYPAIINKMILAVREAGDKAMTSLAAVAGSVADVIADFLFLNDDVSKVVVNNGGDIAIRLRGREKVKVGIKTDLSKEGISHIIEFDSKTGIGGIATSGFGGRSFTKGIASAAVALSSTAALADAAATILGNAVNVYDPLIERALAEDIYPDTDIPGHWVTTKVGNISRSKVQEALASGMVKAIELQKKGVILEALLALKSEVAMTPNILPMIKTL